MPKHQIDSHFEANLNRFLCRLFTKANQILSITRHATSTLSILCKGFQAQALLNLEQVSQCLSVFKQLFRSTDIQILDDAIDAVSYFCTGPNEQIQAVIESGLVRGIIQHLASDHSDIVSASLEVMCNIVDYDVSQLMQLADGQVAQQLVQLLTNAKDPASQFRASCLLNHLASSDMVTLTEAVIKAGAIPAFIYLIQTCQYSDTVEDSVAALGNIAVHSDAYRDSILAQGALPPLLKYALLRCISIFKLI